MFLVMCSFNIAPSDTENFEKRSCMKYKIFPNRTWRFTLMIHPWQVWNRYEFLYQFFCSKLVKRIIGFLTQKQLIMNELITRLCISIGLFKIVIFFKHILSKWDFIDAFRIQSNFKINNKSLWNILFGLINDNVIFFKRAFNLKHKIQDVIC